MQRITILPDVKTASHDIFYNFTLIYDDMRPDVQIYYRVSGYSCQSPNFDGILFAVIFHAMQEGFDVKVDGPVSLEAILNVNEFQSAWSSWKPKRYKKISVYASELIDSTAPKLNQAISAFSGGVDATFTLFNHCPAATGSHRPVQACMLVHGFDISINNTAAFERVRQKYEAMHTSLGIKTFYVSTNIKALQLQDWEDSFAAQLVSCLQLFSEDFGVGLRNRFILTLRS